MSQQDGQQQCPESDSAPQKGTASTCRLVIVYRHGFSTSSLRSACYAASHILSRGIGCGRAYERNPTYLSRNHDSSEACPRSPDGGHGDDGIRTSLHGLGAATARG